MDDVRILVVDDDPAVGMVLGALLEQAGHEVEQVGSGEAAVAALGRRAFDVVITDQRMPGMDGMTLLSHARERWPETPILMLTAHGSIPLAVAAMKAGAYDFVVKPFDREEILFAVEKAAKTGRHRSAQPATRGGGRLFGRSRAMVEVERLIDKAAAGRATVLVRGESGTGKSLVARAIHERSPRSGGPFVQIHCGALPDNLLESELFGYEKGAFTGAVTSKPGRVELAEGGTLFLDEIGDVSPAFQVKLLRLLQEREYERLGGTSTVPVDVRFVAATHRDLEQMVARGEFREDLFYRLNVVPVVLPPLSHRTDEIPELARHFAVEHAAANGRPELVLDESAIAALAKLPWPGNVRHLQNFVERLIVLCEGPAITAKDVAKEAEKLERITEPTPKLTLDDQRRAAEREALLEALQRADDNRSRAARILGVSRRTLYNKLHEHGLL